MKIKQKSLIKIKKILLLCSYISDQKHHKSALKPEKTTFLYEINKTHAPKIWDGNRHHNI